MQTMNRFNIHHAGESLSFYLASRLPCESRGSALQAKLKTSGQWLDDYGILPEKYHASVDKSGYVVYSYHTPIAWLADNAPSPTSLGCTSGGNILVSGLDRVVPPGVRSKIVRPTITN